MKLNSCPPPNTVTGRIARPWWQHAFAMLLPVLAASTVHAGTHVWSGAGSNNFWSNAANWSSGGAPVPNETNVVLIFPSNATGFTSTQNVNNLSVDRMEFNKPSTGVDYTFPTGGIGLTLTGVAGDNILVKDARVIWQPGLNLQNTCRVNVGLAVSGFPGQFDIQGFVGGNGGLVKQGLGTLQFTTGSVANTFTGTLRVEAGDLDLGKVAGSDCFGGNLEIIGGVVTIRRSNQIPDASAITIGNGRLIISPDSGVGATSERIGPVTFTGTTSLDNLRVTSPSSFILGGTVACATGTGIRGRMVADAPSGQFTLDGTTRVFTVPDPTSFLELEGNLANGTGTGGFTKQGEGQMVIHHATTFSGIATVAAGILSIKNDQSLGSTAGATTVQAGGQLDLGYSTVAVTLPAAETINLAGRLHAYNTTTVNGPIVLSGTPSMTTASGDVLTHTGVISGSGTPLDVGGFGTVVMAGTASNTLSGTVSVSGKLHLNKTNATAIPGTVRVNGGILTLLAPNQIADAGSVMIEPSGTFDLNDQNETIAYLFGGSAGAYVDLGNATLTLNGTSNVQLGNATTQSNVHIFGSALSKVRKLGSNTWTLYQTSLPDLPQPTLTVEGGTVELYGLWSGPIEAKAGMLRGSAHTGAITGMGGHICLCDFTASSFSGAAIVHVAINGGTPGTEFDRLISSGPVNLTGQSIQFSLGAFTPMTHGRFTIIDRSFGDSVVTGAFNGLAEGAKFTLNGLPFSITYKGGRDSNDVQLIFLGTGTPAPEITSITRVGTTTTINVSWLPAKAGQKIYIESATGPTADRMSSWSSQGSVTLNAQGKGSLTYNEFQTSMFYRLQVE